MPTTTAVFRAVGEFASVNRAVRKTRRELAALQAQAADTSGFDAFGDALERTADAQKKLRVETTALTKADRSLYRAQDALAGSAKRDALATAGATKTTKSHATATKATDVVVRRLHDAQLRARGSSASLATAQRNAGTAAGRLTASASTLASAERRAADASNRHVDALRRERDVAGTKATALGKLAMALGKVTSAESAASSAASRHADALNRESRAARSSTASNSALSGALGGVGAASGRAASGANRATRSFGGFRAVLRSLLPILLGLGVPLVVAGVQTLGAAVSSLIGGLVGLIGAAGPAVGALAALGPAALAAAGAAGTLALAFRGVGKALKAGTAADEQAASAAQASAKQRAAAARAVVDAQYSLRQAVEAGARAAEQASRDVDAANDRLLDSNRAVLRAERDLHDARRQALRDLADLADAVADNANSIEGAEISLLRAQERQREVNADAESSVLDRREAAHSVASAEEQLARVRRDAERDQLALSEAESKGVEGSRVVLDASEALRDAHEDRREAGQALTDAVREQSRTQADATEQVSRAQAQLAEAISAAALASTEGSAAAQKYQQALDALSPAGQAFVAYLRSLSPLINELSHAAQEALFPGLISALRILSPMIRSVAIPAVTAFGEALGTLAVDGALRLRSFEADLLAFGTGDGPALMGDFGRTLLNLAEVLGHVTFAAMPLARWLSNMIELWSANLLLTTKTARESGRLARFFEKTKDTLKLLGAVLKNVGSIMYSTFKAAAPMGRRLLETFRDLTGETARFLKTAEGQNKLRKYFDDLEPNIRLTTKLLGQAALAFARLGASEGATAVLRAIDVELAPALGRLGEALGNLTESVGPGLVSMLASFADALTNVLNAGGGSYFAAFVLVFDTFATVLEAITSIPGVGQIAGVLLGIAGALAALRAIGTLNNLVGVSAAIASLAPSAVTARVVGLASSITAAGAAAAAMTTRFTGSAAAGARVASVSAGVASAVTAVAGALPLAAVAVGVAALAYDGLTTSSKEARQAIEAGGAASVAAVQGLARQTVWSELPVIGKGIDFITTDLEEFRAKLHGVELANYDASVALNNYQTAVTQFGEGSPEAVAKQRLYAEAARLVGVEQRAAAAGTSAHTQSMIEQRDHMLGSIDAEIAWEAAVDSLTESVAANGVTTDKSTAAGRANVMALQAMSRAALEDLTAMQQQGVGVAEITAKEGRYREQLIASAMQIGYTRAEAVRYVDQLHLVPPAVSTDVKAPGAQAARDQVQGLNRDVTNLDGKRANIFVRFWRELRDVFVDPDGSVNWFARGGIQIPAVGMARGGVRTMRRDVAQTVDPRQPVLMGDRMRGKEYFLPDDDSPRSLEIGAQWAADRGLRLVPMATGGVLGEPASVPHGAGTAPPGALPALETDPSAVSALTVAVSELAREALGPLATRISEVVVPALRLMQRVASVEGVTALDALSVAVVATQEEQSARYAQLGVDVSAATGSMTTSLGLLQGFSNVAWADMARQVWLRITTIVGPLFGLLASGQRGVEASTSRLQGMTSFSWASMLSATSANVGQITGPVFGGLHNAMSSVSHHGVTMADGWTAQLARLRAAAANPIRWIMQFPLGPPGIAASWNTLDNQFKLGKRVVPPAPNFAEGGFHEDHRPQITRRGGPSRLWSEPETGGEAYIPMGESKRSRSTGVLSEVADRFGYKMVPKGDPELFADGGLWRRMGGVIQSAVPGTRVTSGYRPGDPGYHGRGKAVDLAGSRSMDMAHMLRVNRHIANNFANSTQLIHTQPGSINLYHGRPHTYNAGTRADHRDHVHWALENEAMLRGVKGNYTGAGGGPAAPPDPTPMVNAAFKRTYDLIAETTRLHGNSPFVVGSQAVSKQAADAVRAKALEMVTAALSSSSGGAMGAVGAGAPFHVREISRQAKARGFGAEGAAIGTATGLVESNLRNLGSTRYPESRNMPGVEGIGSDHDSVGVFQQRPSQGWGTVAQCMNTAYAAGQFFSRFPSNWRSQDPGMVAANVQRPAARYRYKYGTRMAQARGLVQQYGMLDTGGDWKSGTFGFNGSGETEHVLTGRERAGFLRLVEIMDGAVARSRAPGPPAWLTAALSDMRPRAAGGHAADLFAPVAPPSLSRADIDAALTTLRRHVGEAVSAAVSAARGTDVDVSFTVYNPVPEPASDTAARKMRSLALMGVFG